MKRLILLWLLAVPLAWAQPQTQVPILYYTINPSGLTCPGPQYEAYSSNTNTQYYCSTTWTAFAGGGGGSGTVTSVAFPTIPSWLTATVTNPTTAASIAITLTAAQTSHQVIGTCGSGTTFTPCSLVLADLPSTVVNATSPGAGIAHFAGSTQTVTSSAVSLTADVTGILPSANGGTGINNTATLTLGSSNQNWASLSTGIVYNTTTTGAISVAGAHRISTPLQCADSSGSGTVQSCTSAPSFTLNTGDEIIYSTTTANTGDVTVAVNGGAAVHVRKWQGASVLASGDLAANVPTLMVYDGTYWEISTIGNAPAGGGSGISGLTANYIPVAGSATTITANSHLDDGVTTAATITSTEAMVAPSYTTNGSTGGILSLLQGTAPTITANSVGWSAPTAVTTALSLQFPNAVPTANQFLLFPAPTSNVSQGAWTTFASTNLTDTANLVRNNGINSGTSAMTLNMTAANGPNAFRFPAGGGTYAGPPTAALSCIADTQTGNNLHCFTTADSVVGMFLYGSAGAGLPTNGDLVSVAVNAGTKNVELTDGGSWASPGAAIGTGTAVAGTFTTLTSGLAATAGDALITSSTTGLALTGTAPASVSTTPGTAAPTLFSVSGVAGGASSNATGVGGVGSPATIAGGVGGAGTGTNAVGGAGGGISLSPGNGGGSLGTGVNSNGGSVTVTPGTAGTGGSGTAGKQGVLGVAGTGAGFTYFTQGAAATTANSNVPANSIIEQAPTSVTAYTVTKPTAAPANNFSSKTTTTAGVETYSKMPQTAMLTTQYTNSTTGFTNVTGGNSLAFTMDANTTYQGYCTLYYQAASTGGLNIEFTGPASPTFVTYGLVDPGSATTLVSAGVATSYSTSLGAAVTTATTNFPATVTFGISNGNSSGTLQLLAKSSAAAQLQIQTGSFCVMQ